MFHPKSRCPDNSRVSGEVNYYKTSQEPEAVELVKKARRDVCCILGKLTSPAQGVDEVKEALLNTGVTQHVTDDIRHGMDLVTMDTVFTLFCNFV